MLHIGPCVQSFLLYFRKLNDRLIGLIDWTSHTRFPSHSRRPRRPRSLDRRRLGTGVRSHSNAGTRRPGSRAFRQRVARSAGRAWRRRTGTSCRRTPRRSRPTPRDGSWRTPPPTHCRIACRRALHDTVHQIHVRHTASCFRIREYQIYSPLLKCKRRSLLDTPQLDVIFDHECIIFSVNHVGY